MLWMRILAAKAGARRPKVVVIDPRRTLSVETGPDLHLQLRPGTNVALLNGLCHLLIEQGSIDRAFIERHTVKFEQLRDVVSRYPPARVEELSGVPQASLRQAAEWIGTSPETVTTCLQGVYQSNQATAAACAVNNMHLLMGKIWPPGQCTDAVCRPAEFHVYPRDRGERDLPATATGRTPITCATSGRAGMCRRDARQETRHHARDLRALRERLCEGPVEHLHEPSGEHDHRGTHLRTLNGVFLIVQDGFADTETAQLADILLRGHLGEKTGCMTNAERRCTLLRKVCRPAGEARADLDIFLEFAARMDLRDAGGAPLIGYVNPEGAFNEWREISRGYIPDYSGMTYARLAETRRPAMAVHGGASRWNAPVVHGPGVSDQ